MKISGRFVQTLQKFQLGYPVNTGRKLNVHKTFSTSSERLMYVQFTSCVYGKLLEQCKKFAQSLQ